MSQNRRVAGTRRGPVLCLIPIPPPWSGPEVCADLFLRYANAHQIDVVHVATNAGARNAGKGRVTLGALARLAAAVVATLRAVARSRPRVAYVYLSQNRSGFLRDAVLVGCCLASGVPVVAHVHGSNFGNFVAAAPRALAACTRFFVRRLAGVILLAERFRPQFESLLSPARIAVIYNCIDGKLLATSPARSSDRRPITVLSVGHLSIAKGFADMLQVIPAVVGQRPDVCFEFAGEWLLEEHNIARDEMGAPLPQHDLRAGWEQIAARYPRNARLLGTITGAQKLEALRRADIFMFASYSEGFPMAVLEAMGAGLPLVTTSVGALAEVLTDGVNGHLVTPGDVTALAGAVLRLADDAPTRALMGRHNEQQVKERFSPDVCIPKILRALDTWAAR